MASDSSGKIGFPNTGREPFVGSNDLVYYSRGVLGQPEIFSMNKDGSNQTQVTFNGKYGNIDAPKHWMPYPTTSKISVFLLQKRRSNPSALSAIFFRQVLDCFIIHFGIITENKTNRHGSKSR